MTTTDRRDGARSAIVVAAARLLQEQGPSAVTTRAVAEAAGVQAPTLYRLFGDKDGLLEAVAEHVMAGFVAAKATTIRAAAAEDVDPLEDLREGWRTQVAFGVANPGLFRLFSEPERVRHSPAAEAGRRVLEARVRRVAATGRLRVSEQRAVGLIQAAGIGAIMTLLSVPPERRDPGLADDIYEAVLRQLLSDAPPPADTGPAAAAVALRAVTPQLDALSSAERQVLAEWLDRIVEGATREGVPAPGPVGSTA